MKPMVSVILPYYEGLTWLRRSIQSVRKQQGVCWELIIVDDGSKHDPTAIVQSLQDDRLRLIRIEHSGKGAALNEGVANSRADIICFLDQDDIMNPGCLSLQYEAFQRNPAVDVVYSDFESVHDDGRIIHRFIHHQVSNKERSSITKSLAFVSMHTIMMKKVIFNKIRGFSRDIQLTGVDDTEFFVRLLVSGAVLHYVPSVVQKWVFHGKNYSESAEYQQALVIFLKHLSKHAQTNPAIRKELPYFQYRMFFMRGLFFIERSRPAEAMVEFLKAVRARPCNINGYYLLLKSWAKKIRLLG
jgi:glycosyltransferase involved in cell wall biosynthesis